MHPRRLERGDDPLVEMFPMHFARPTVWSGVVLWLRGDRRRDEEWVVPNLPRFYGPNEDIDDEVEAYRDMLVDRFADYGW